jgi:hypothetical protein
MELGDAVAYAHRQIAIFRQTPKVEPAQPG